jgi:hypothetical protein
MVKRRLLAGKPVNGNKSETFDYRCHILIGCASAGNMTVICHWLHLPRQAEVEQAMNAQKGYVTFLLCTPTSILPVKRNGERKQQSSGS